MSIKVLYFASLRETLGYSHETLTLPANIATLGAIIWPDAAACGRRWKKGATCALPSTKTWPAPKWPWPIGTKSPSFRR